MKRTVLIYTFIAAFLLNGCTTPFLARSWKAPNTVYRSYNKILVVGAVKSPDTNLRRHIETQFVNDLKALGYNAVSAVEEYGATGLANLEQEATYVKLCNRGIDVIITVALLDKTKGAQEELDASKYYSNLYYYNHIWNYKKLEADLADTAAFIDPAKRYFIESILFDLQTLQPVYVVQTKFFDPASLKTMEQEYGKRVIKNMLSHKVLMKHPESQHEKVKAF